MKNYFFSVTFLLISCTFSWHANAQILPTFFNPEIYVSPYGLDGVADYGVGSDFTDAISPARLMDIIQQNNIYTGNVTIYFAGGDYYTDFEFSNLANSISHLEIYGGFDPSVTDIDLTTRDLITNETRFHATGNSATLSIAPLPYYGNTITSDFCIVDGITITSDNIQINYHALFLVGVNCLVSQLKIENFSTTNKLIFLEGPDYTTTIVNSLFTDNEANNFIGLCSNTNFINTTIAGNDFKEEMLIPYSGEYTNIMWNTIVYGNSNMDMDYTYYTTCSFNVRHSILEDIETWIIDDGGNWFNTDPLFTNLTHTPYSCDYSSSPARMNGEPSFITSLEINPLLVSNPPATIIDTAIIFYDVVNMYRFGSYEYTSIDIGAHQNGDDYNPYFRIQRPLENKINQNSNVDEGTGTKTLVLYNAAGQMVYSGVLNNGTNTIPASLSAGTYIVRTLSVEGKDNYTKLIVIR